jgi:steroid 5-alpha reductase family enzyme
MSALNLILWVAVFMAVAMTLAWVVQRVSGNAGWVDVVWTFGTGLAGLAFALVPPPEATAPSARQIAIAALVALWSLRLGLHLAVRVAHGPEDARYNALRTTWGAAFQSRLFWFLEMQALCSLLLGLAILLAARNPAPGLRPLDLAGAAVLAIAIIGEGIADRQLARFKSDPANRGRICDVGLWGWSRHPNYFFEWFGWLAYPLFAIELGGAHPWGWLAFLGPALMYALLVHVSGIPPVEENMLRSRGPAYRAYQQRTNAFFPGPPRPAVSLTTEPSQHP